MVGILATVNAFIGRRTTLSASADGLCERTGRATTQLPWDACVWLTVALEKGNPNSCTVLGHGGGLIAWPARGAIWRAGRRGQPLIGPEELAAIVAERSGLQLAIREA